MKKRLLAIILACAMVVTCLPVVAFADDVPQGEISVEETNAKYARIMDIIGYLAQHYANDPEIAAEIEQLNAIIDEWQESTVGMVGLVEAYQEKINDVYGLIKEGKLDEVKEALDGIPFDEIDAKMAVLVGYIETTAKIANAIADKLEDNEAVQKIKELIGEAVELKEFLQDYVSTEDFSVAKIVNDFQDLIQAHQDDIINFVMDLTNKIAALDEHIATEHPETYAAIQGYLQAIRDNVKAAAEAEPEAIENIKEALKTIMGYISGSKEAAQQIVNAIEAKLGEIATQAQAYKEQAQAKLADIQDTIVAIAQAVKDIDFEEVAQNVKASIQGIIAAVQEGAVANILNNLILQIKGAIQKVKESGVVADTIQDLVGKIQALRDVIETIKEINPIGQAGEKLEALKTVAENLIKQYGKAIVSNLVQRFMNGDFDAIFEKMGITKEEAIAKLIELLPYIVDIRAYIQGLIDGEGYLTLVYAKEGLEFMNNLLEEENKNLDEEISSLVDSGLDLQSYYDTYSANLKNAIKVAKGKPVLNSAKSAKKGKKVTVKFKGLKKAKVSYYQVKIGKKTYTVKKATSSDKAVKAVIKAKGLKVGTTVKVKVRAVYAFKYRPIPADATVTKTAKYASKWSNVIKMKVK